MADVCISTVADRHALHFIYYSSVKKTVFDLTKRVSASRKASFDAIASRIDAAAARATQARRNSARIVRAMQKHR